MKGVLSREPKKQAAPFYDQTQYLANGGDFCRCCRRAEGREEGVGVLHQFLITGHTGMYGTLPGSQSRRLEGSKRGINWRRRAANPTSGSRRRSPHPAGMSAARRHAHLSDLDVRLVDGLRVQADDLLHVDDVALFDVLEFLRGGKKRKLSE